jgi:penicillin-binding protein 1A
MAAEGFIAREEAHQAKARPIVVRNEPSRGPSVAPYFVEEVRKHLEARYGAKRLYESGLSVATTLDATLQAAANRAVEQGLRRLDKRRGFRGPIGNVLEDGETLETFRDDRWAYTLAPGDVVPALVLAVSSSTSGGAARLRIGEYRATLTREEFAWTRRTAASNLVRPGDLIEVEIRSLDESAKTATVALEQTPLVEGALVAIDNRTGQIKAMVGGWNFGRSKFNRAVQAFRQLGSTFKPIVYTAAIDRGFTPASAIEDAPISYPLVTGGVWEPQNYDHTFEGQVTLRRALEQSRNIPAIRVMEAVGPESVLAYAKRFGFTQPFGPYLPIALGAGDGTLLEVTSAYSVFPNRGVRMRPFGVRTVTDRDGALLEENRAEPIDVIRADTAFIMTSLLRGVVAHGTGQAAASLNWPLAGKTGTVDDNTDAWFVGFDPNLTVGVWTGLDEKKSLGGSETGAQAALPIWMEFMRAYIESRPDPEEPPQFEAPGNIVLLPVDAATGELATPGAPGIIMETFISGTQPGGFGLEP